MLKAPARALVLVCFFHVEPETESGALYSNRWKSLAVCVRKVPSTAAKRWENFFVSGLIKRLQGDCT